MAKAFVKEMKAQLDDEVRQLTERLQRITAANPHDRADYQARFPQFGTKDDDNAAEVATFQDNLGLSRDLEASLADVQAALKRIDDGTYGRCTKCGELIGEARLRAFPAATLCVRCKANTR